MKKILCFVLSIILILSTFVSASAITYDTNIKDLSNYEVYRIDFNNNSNYTLSVNGNVKNDINGYDASLESRLNACEEMVKGLDLKSKGLESFEKALIEEINLLKSKNNIKLNSYEVYVPDMSGIGLSAISDPIYYGSYNGYTVLAGYSVYDYSVSIEATGNLLDKFASGLVNIVMGTLSLEYSITYAAFMSLCNIIEKDAIWIYGMTRQIVNQPTEHTTKYLFIEDKLNQYYEDYVLLYQDEAAVYGYEIITVTASPYVPSFIKYGDIGQENTIDFYDAQGAMQRLYNRYMSGLNEIIHDRLPDVLVDYQ